jgi:signal transduction histidine kinase
MSTETLLEKITPRTRRAFGVGVLLALCVLAATIFSAWLLVRSLVRQQITQRDAQALHATTLMEQLDARSGAEGDLGDDAVGFEAALLASRLDGVMGIRFFDPSGRFTDSFPAAIQPKSLEPDALDSARQLKPHSRFQEAVPLSDIFIYLPQFATGRVARTPLLEVTVPLHRRDGQKLAGAAQFLVAGQGIAAEYARLDRHLAWLAVAAFVTSGLLLAGLLWPVFRQVEQLNRQLQIRGERLWRANQELALAARAAAVGAVSAHLMHGLKNPLASLSEFVAGQQTAETASNGEGLHDALAAARRMQQLVEQTLEVLADTRGGPTYEMTVRELVDSVRKSVEPVAAKRELTLTTTVESNEALSSRKANLISLILVNLLENGIEATASQGSVSLTVKAASGSLSFGVRDQGAGFPEHLRNRLFLPCSSTREGGSGIGLAISKQLADYLGAELALKESGPAGCHFMLEVPLADQAGTDPRIARDALAS